MRSEITPETYVQNFYIWMQFVNIWNFHRHSNQPDSQHPVAFDKGFPLQPHQVILARFVPQEDLETLGDLPNIAICYGKPPSLIGKLTISMTMFNSKLLVITRLSISSALPA